MKKDNLIRFLSLSLLIVLIAATVLVMNGCGKTSGDTLTESQTQSAFSNAKTVGKGGNSFKFTVIDDKGGTEYFIVKTDDTSVGKALEKAKLISGTVGDYGLMVDTVNGVKLVYETDKRYWAFYVDGKYASNSVDQTEIEDGKIYSFKNEKA